MNPRYSAGVALLVGIVGLLGTSGVSASASTATLSVTDTAGQTDPAAGVPRVFTISGVASAPSRVYVKYRNIGGAPCAASPTADTGSSSSLFPVVPNYSWSTPVNGTFVSQRAGTWSSPGPTQFCIWIVPAGGASVVTPITQVIDFRSPAASLSIGIAPLTPRPQERTSITLSGTTESPRKLFAKVKSGIDCAPTYDSDSGTAVLSGSEIDGAFSLATSLERGAGRYTVCAWLGSVNGDAALAVGPQAATFEVIPPPKPTCSVVDRSRKRGLQFRVRCQHLANRSVRVRYQRGTRTVTRKAKHRSGQLRAPTKGLSYGAWRVTVLVDGTTIKAGRITVRRR